MRSHRGARRDRRGSLAGWWPAAECIAAPVPADRHRNLSMALTLVALTLLFLALAMFGPAQPGGADGAGPGSADPVVERTAVVGAVVPPATAAPAIWTASPSQAPEKATERPRGHTRSAR